MVDESIPSSVTDSNESALPSDFHWDPDDPRTAVILEKVRQEWKKNDDRRDEGLAPTSPDVERFNDIAYGPDPKWNLLDVTLPAHATGKLPVIINVHGGGWFYGTKETYQFYCMGLARRGFAVVSFNYRVAPIARYPQELDDVNAAAHWVADPDNAQKYHFDLNNVFFVGDSAGGQLEMQYMACLFNAKYRAFFGYSVPQFTVRAVADNCGASFITLPGMVSGVVSAYFTPQVLADHHEDLQYEKYLTGHIPPVFIMTASNDAVRDCSVRLDGYMIGRSLTHVFRSYGSDQNPRYHVFHVSQKDQLAEQCNDDEMAFFRKYLVK
jgi:acetyl esterase/lipase